MLTRQIARDNFGCEHVYIYMYIQYIMYVCVCGGGFIDITFIFHTAYLGSNLCTCMESQNCAKTSHILFV